MPDRARRFVALTLLSVILAVGLAAASDEGELLRRIKSDVFDRLWPQVLTECDEFIASFPRSQALPRAYYYRAQALESLKRNDEAIKAYSEFLKRFSSETGALREDALLKRITLARIQYQNKLTGNLGVILEGMDEDGATQIYAAIEAAKIDHVPAQKKAIPVLKDCAQFETQEELKNECVVALLRLDPKQVPAGAGTSATPGANQAKLIRIEVFNKLQKKVMVRVNLPIAFAELALESLTENYRHIIEQKLATIEGPDSPDNPGMPKTLPDFKKLLEAVRSGGAQTLVEIDGEEDFIKVWIE